MGGMPSLSENSVDCQGGKKFLALHLGIHTRDVGPFFLFHSPLPPPLRRHCLWMDPWGPSIKYVSTFIAIFDTPLFPHVITFPLIFDPTPLKKCRRNLWTFPCSALHVASANDAQHACRLPFGQYYNTIKVQVF